MTVLINPGSCIGAPGKGWTNTREGACSEAERWLREMHGDGLRDVELVAGEPQEHEGRWTFQFRHTVTGTTVDLTTHGIDDSDAYEKQHVFFPRVYWRGSSIGSPQLEDFAADGFEMVKTYRPASDGA